MVEELGQAEGLKGFGERRARAARARQNQKGQKEMQEGTPCMGGITSGAVDVSSSPGLVQLGRVARGGLSSVDCAKRSADHGRVSRWYEFDDGMRSHTDRKSTRLNSSHSGESRMPSSA